MKLIKSKEGGTGEALKLKLHLNSEVYKREFFNDFGLEEGEKIFSFT